MGMRSILIAAALLVAMTANAVPVTWTVDNLLFDDGGTASGSFVYDASENTYADINLVTTAGSGFGGASYTLLVDSAPNNSTYLAAMVFPLEGLPALALSFASALTNAGGLVALDGNSEFICGQECEYPVATLRSITSGQVSAVPVPAAVWLFGSALAGLGWMRRK